MSLAERLGLFLGQACSGTLERIEVGVYGDLQEFDVKILLASALTGLLKTRMPTGVTMVNAVSVAAEKGIAVVESTSSAPTAFPNLIAMRLKTADEELSVAGTVFSAGHLRLVDVDGVEVDTIPQGHILLIKNDDTPGIVGQIGMALGKRSVNIARMGLGRKPGSGRAIMLIEVDSALLPEVVAELPTITGIREARFVELG
jgi:D-3-phosphoglycerate dehydrogenase